MKYKLKYLELSLVFMLVLVSSCSNKTTKITADKNNGFVTGVITSKYKKEGCDFLIEANLKGKEVIYAAINLNENFKQDGKQITFRFRPTRAPRKGNCKLGVYIYIEEFK